MAKRAGVDISAGQACFVPHPASPYCHIGSSEHSASQTLYTTSNRTATEHSRAADLCSLLPWSVLHEQPTCRSLKVTEEDNGTLDGD